MRLLKSLKKAAGYFLATLLGSNPTHEQMANAVLHMPKLRIVNDYPRPNYGKSGIAAAKRAARKTRNRKKGRKS